MITNHVSKLSICAVLGENFERAIRFAAEVDLDAVEVGHYELDGKLVYANVIERQLHEMPALWEVHEQYADIHLILAGSESIGYCPISRLKEIPVVDPSTDSALINNVSGALIDLEAGEFLVAMPEDVHLPNCPGKHGAYSKKMIIKVRI